MDSTTKIRSRYCTPLCRALSFDHAVFVYANGNTGSGAGKGGERGRDLSRVLHAMNYTVLGFPTPESVDRLLAIFSLFYRRGFPENVRLCTFVYRAQGSVHFWQMATQSGGDLD
jgi:hypothetical protein